MTAIRGIVFDLDDTVFLERDYVASGFREVGRWARTELGLEGIGERAWEQFRRGSRRRVLTDVLAEAGVEVTEELRDRVVRVYRMHRPDIRMLDDAARFVEALSGRVRLGVVTDGPSESQRAKATALRIEEVADPVVVTAELGTSKPDPAVFLRAVRDWDLPPASLAYIGDNPRKDFQGPRSLGWKTVRVRRPLSLHVDVPTPPGVPEVDDLDTVTSWLQGREWPPDVPSAARPVNQGVVEP